MHATPALPRIGPSRGHDGNSTNLTAVLLGSIALSLLPGVDARLRKRRAGAGIDDREELP